MSRGLGVCRTRTMVLLPDSRDSGPMRAGVAHIVFGCLLLIGGYVADTYVTGLYWFGAYIVGAIEILRGIVGMIRARRLMQ